MEAQKEEKNKNDLPNGNSGVELYETFIFITPKSINSTEKSEKNITKTSKINEDREKSANFLNEIKFKIENELIEKSESSDSSDSSSSSEESESDDDSDISTTKKSKFFCCYDKQLKLNNPMDPNEREKFKNNLRNYQLRKRIFTIIVIFIILCALGYLGYYIKNYRYKYQLLTELDKKIVHEYPVRYANFEVKFQDIFPVGSNGYYHLDRDLVKGMLRKEVKVNLDDKRYEKLNKFVQLSWNTLIKVFKDKVLTSNCSFQGETLSFKRLYDEYPEAFESLSNSEIINILHNKSVSIGQMIKNGSKFYIERKFVRLNTQNFTENLNFDEEILNNRKNDKTNAFLGSKFIDQNNFNRTQVLKEFNDHIDQNKTNSNINVINFDQLIQKFSKNQQLIILSDKPGSGKTTSLKKLAVTFKQKNPSFWVAYIEVRKFMKFMNRRGKVKSVESFLENIFSDSKYFSESIEENEWQSNDFDSQTFHESAPDDSKNIEGFYSQKKISKRNLNDDKWVDTKIDRNTESHQDFSSKYPSKLLNYTKTSPSKFEKEIYKTAYKMNKTLIIWDGFDEISPTYCQYLINVIKEIRLKSQNIQIVSTIPKNLKNLVRKINFEQSHEVQDIQIFSLKSFENSDQKNYIQNYLNFSNLNSKSTNLASKLKIDDIFSKVSLLQINESDIVNMNSPLMIQILIDVILNEDDSINKNYHFMYENIKNLNLLNLYNIFDQFIQIKINKWVEILRSNHEQNFKNFRTSSFKILNSFVFKQENTSKPLNFDDNSSVNKLLIKKILQIFALKYEMSMLKSPIHLKLPNIEIIKNLIFDFIQNKSKLNPNLNLFAQFDEELIRSNTINDKVLELGIISQQFDGSLQISHKVFIDFILAQILIEDFYKLDRCVAIQDVGLKLNLLVDYVRNYDSGDGMLITFIKDYLKLNNNVQKSAKFDENDTKNSSNNFKIEENYENEKVDALNNILNFNSFEISNKTISNNIEPSDKINCVQNLTSKIIPIIKKYSNIIFKENSNNSNFYIENQSNNNLKFSTNLTTCELLDDLNSNITDSQWTDFLTSPANSDIIVNLISNLTKKTSTNEDLEDSQCDDNQIEDFWSKIENLSQEYQQKFFEKIILSYLNSHSDTRTLNYLLNQTENYIESQNISKLINEKNILHSSAKNIKNFEVIWQFYLKHENNTEEHRKILIKNDDGGMWDGNYEIVHRDSECLQDSSRNLKSSQVQSEDINLLQNEQEKSELMNKNQNLNQLNHIRQTDQYFDPIPFKIIHRALLNAKSIESVDIIMNIYSQYFNESEMTDIVTSSSDFFLYFASFSDPNVCDAFAAFLKVFFLFDEQKLQNFLDRRNEEIPLSLINYMNLFNTDLTCTKILYNIPIAIKHFKDNFRSENVAMGNSGFYLTSGKNLTPAEVLNRFKNTPQSSTPKGNWSKIDKNLMKSLTGL